MQIIDDNGKIKKKKKENSYIYIVTNEMTKKNIYIYMHMLCNSLKTLIHQN